MVGAAAATPTTVRVVEVGNVFAVEAFVGRRDGGEGVKPRSTWCDRAAVHK
jgi:hypothetical protein